MIEFKVNRNTIIKYLTKYGFNEPEDFFLTEKLEDGSYSYSISTSDISYKKKTLKVDLKNTLSIIAKDAKDNYDGSSSVEYLFEELLFLICYIGVFQEFGATTNHFINNDNKNLLKVIEAAIHLKNGCLPLKVTIDFGIPRNVGRKMEYNDIHIVTCNAFASPTHLFSSHYLEAFAKFLNINSLNPQFKTLLNQESTIEDLIQLKSDATLQSLTDTNEIKRNATLLFRNFLEDELNITRMKAKNVSAHQLKLLERIFDFLNWRNRSETNKEEDQFRKHINRMLDSNVIS